MIRVVFVLLACVALACGPATELPLEPLDSMNDPIDVSESGPAPAHAVGLELPECTFPHGYVAAPDSTLPRP